MAEHIIANVERFDGIAEGYDASRPSPPAVLPDLLTQMAEVERPKLVVDLGSGTGLSTVVWAGRADRVIGIEPNPDMRRQAQSRVKLMPGCENVSFQDGLGMRTGLPDECADIVTVSQALHWMEPEPTFAEVGRVLRVGGVFAAYDCEWPPTTRREAEEALSCVTSRAELLQKEAGAFKSAERWSKDEHLDRMIASGRFGYVKQVLAHSVEKGNASRLVGLAYSFAGIAILLRTGVSEQELDIDNLREVAARVLGDEPSPWYFSYKIRIAIK